MARLNWQKRAFDFKLKRALKDEEEFSKADRAARFIERAEPTRRPRRHERRKVATETKRQAKADRPSEASGNRAAEVQEKPPWED
jgi:hypothetical protein